MMLCADGFRWQRDGEGEWLCLRSSQAMAVCETLEAGKLYDVEIKRHRQRRSLDANNYFWTLAGKLAAKLGISPNEVYRQYIPDIGDNFKMVPVREKDLKHWDQIWCGGHIGRCTRDIGPCGNVPGYHNVESYYGSSDYDTAQMSRLIDLIVQDCKAQGIEILTPRELDALKERWGR